MKDLKSITEVWSVTRQGELAFHIRSDLLWGPWDASGHRTKTCNEDGANLEQLIVALRQGKPSCCNNTNLVSDFFVYTVVSYISRCCYIFSLQFSFLVLFCCGVGGRFSSVLWIYQSLHMLSSLLYATEHACLLKVRGKKINSQCQQFDNIYFLLSFFPSYYSRVWEWR